MLLRVAVKTEAASPGMRMMGRQDGAHEGWGGGGGGGAAEEDVRRMREMREMRKRSIDEEDMRKSNNESLETPVTEQLII